MNILHRVSEVVGIERQVSRKNVEKTRPKIYHVASSHTMLASMQIVCETLTNYREYPTFFRAGLYDISYNKILNHVSLHR